VTNQSDEVGSYFQVRLHGVKSARDAIGARVTLTAAGRTWTRYLLAGDGYMASNERLVPFGIGNVESVDRILIEWPSGSTSTASQLPANATLTVVEGKSMAGISQNASLSSISLGVGDPE